jgi:hypothetical protein
MILVAGKRRYRRQTEILKSTVSAVKDIEREYKRTDENDYDANVCTNDRKVQLQCMMEEADV